MVGGFYEGVTSWFGCPVCASMVGGGRAKEVVDEVALCIDGSVCVRGGRCADPAGRLAAGLPDRGYGSDALLQRQGAASESAKPGEPFFGQDGFYEGPKPGYRDNGDGTVTDLNTG